MAIDSATKRKSISGIMLGIPGVTPDASEGQAWRQSVGWSYTGILAQELDVFDAAGRYRWVQMYFARTDPMCGRRLLPMYHRRLEYP